VGLLADLELELVDVLEVVLPQPLALLRCLGGARLLSHRRRLCLLSFHFYRRHIDNTKYRRVLDFGSERKSLFVVQVPQAAVRKPFVIRKILLYWTRLILFRKQKESCWRVGLGLRVRTIMGRKLRVRLLISFVGNLFIYFLCDIW
jgi:hypothetical protein